MRTLQGFEARRPLALPLLATRAVAGFPSPADDHLERRLDLNEHLVRNPLSTFFLRVDGDSMSGAGILPGALIVVAEVGGEFTVKHLERDHAGAWSLRADSPRWPGWSLPFTPECRIWGTVVAVVRRC
ncbi:MAG: translesion error-prone polymerase autoproteolytic subunit [Verrucomicrobiota bacterium]